MQTNTSVPFSESYAARQVRTPTDRLHTVLGALLGTQNGRDVEIVNSFELAVEDDGVTVDQGFLISRKELCTSCSAHAVL